MDKKRVLLITTGGTIACVSGTEGFSPALTGEQLLHCVPGLLPQIDIDVYAVLNKDSSNMSPNDWVVIANAIQEKYSEYDGIVVLHGTDTMAYSAAGVSFMTMGIDCPVIFTGAQKPMREADSDAPKNLKDAVCAAAFLKLKGVFIVFAGWLLNGCGAFKASTTDISAFESYSGKIVGEVIDNNIKLINIPPRNWDNGYRWIQKVNDRVLYIKIIPGFKLELLEVARQAKYKIVILEAFGLGGLPSETNGLLKEISELCRNGILVIVTTQCSHGQCDMTVYKVGQEALKCGVVCADIYGKETLVAKVMWGLGISDNIEVLLNILNYNFCGETEK